MKLDNSEETPLRPVFLPPRDAVTARQVGTLLTAARVLYSCVHPPIETEEDFPTKPGGPADGGARLAAEMSFVKVCQRLDEIFDDESRWSMKDQDTLEKDMSHLLQLQSEAAAAHKQAVLSTQLPQFKIRPLLVKLSSEAWVAYIGNLADPNDSIVALGVYPQDAMDNFDRVYLGHSPERAHQALLDEILAKLKRTRGDIKNEIKMDIGTGLPASHPDSPKEDSPRNREDSGNDEEGD